MTHCCKHIYTMLDVNNYVWWDVRVVGHRGPIESMYSFLCLVSKAEAEAAKDCTSKLLTTYV